MSSSDDSATTSTATSPSSRGSWTSSASRLTRSSTRRRAPGWRSSSTALTVRTRRAISTVLVEEPLGGVVLLDVVAPLHRQGADRQALASGADGLLQLVEED